MFASVHIRDFALAAALKARPELAHRPCAILMTGAGRTAETKLPLRALNAAARNTGIGEGWPLDRSLVRCPDLLVLGSAPTAEIELRNELIEFGESISPDLEITAPDAITMDVGRSRMPVKELLRNDFLPSLEIAFALAATPDLAHLASRIPRLNGRPITPVDLEGCDFEILQKLAFPNALVRVVESWGLRRVGDFMKLPRQALAERLGPLAGYWHDVVHGKSTRLLRLHRVPESFLQQVDLEDATAAVEALVFTVHRSLQTLASRLAARNLAVSLIELILVLETGLKVVRRIRLPEPQVSAEAILPPLRTWIETVQLKGAVIGIRLDCETTAPTATQREWFGRQLPQPGRWVETLANLEALLGPERVGIPIPPVTHQSDRTGLRHPSNLNNSNPQPTASPSTTIPLARFRPPRLVAVAHEIRDRLPWPLALLTGPHPGEIVDRRGPFPFSGCWWQSDSSWQRLEWDISMADRNLLRLAFIPPDRWQLEGVYP